MSTRIEGHTEVSGPKGFVHSRKIEVHLGEMFDNVVIGLDVHVSHLAQPEVHSLSSPRSISVK